MIITQQQFNSVVNGLRTQLELQRAFSEEIIRERNAASDWAKIDSEEIQRLRADKEVLMGQVATLSAIANQTEAANRLMAENVAQQEGMIARLKKRFTPSKKSTAKTN